MATLGLSYAGNGRKMEDAIAFAESDKETLELLAGNHEVEIYNLGSLHPGFRADNSKQLVELRRALIEKSRDDKLHYFQMYPIKI